MIAYYPFLGARLTVSALFSVAVHALILIIFTGVVLFPSDFTQPIKHLEVTLAPSLDEREPQKEKKRQQSKAQIQGNAQLATRPQVQQQETSWQSILDQRAKHRTVSAATHEARDAEYLTRWRDRVEEFGTQYYQGKIKEKPLAGEVRILVAIGSKGQLVNAQIRESSGQPALDAIAMEILHKTAPFEPLPAEITSDTDVLEIIRTWRFSVHEGLRTQ